MEKSILMARVLHGAEVERTGTVQALETAWREALAAGDLETAAQLARQKRDKLLEDVDARGSIYRMELEAPSGNSFAAWLPVLRKLAGICGDAWAAYRRKLLDVPQQEGFPCRIEWPERPDAETEIE